MKKIGYVLTFLVSVIFIPRVYALNYEISALDEISVTMGSKVEIDVAIENVTSVDGVSVCSMNILFDKNIELESKPRTLGSWTMTTGNMYLFDTGSPVIDRSDMFTIPVVVNGNGSVQLTNILCSDGIDEVNVDNKKINFIVVNGQANSNNVNNDEPTTNNKPDSDKPIGNEGNLKTSNCNLSDIKLSEGTIEFDSNVTEYEVNISNFDNFSVTPTLEDNTSSYVIDKKITEDGGNVVITVTSASGDIKKYTIYTIAEDSDVVYEPVKKNNYVPIFIGIIVLLVLINVIRIGVSTKKNREQI